MAEASHSTLSILYGYSTRLNRVELIFEELTETITKFVKINDYLSTDQLTFTRFDPYLVYAK